MATNLFNFGQQQTIKVFAQKEFVCLVAIYKVKIKFFSFEIELDFVIIQIRFEMKVSSIFLRFILEFSSSLTRYILKIFPKSTKFIGKSTTFFKISFSIFVDKIWLVLPIKIQKNEVLCTSMENPFGCKIPV